jgi:hypothetical protein
MAEIILFKNGKVSERWGYYEEMKMMMQLGLIPAPGAEQEMRDTAKTM